MEIKKLYVMTVNGVNKFFASESDRVYARMVLSFSDPVAANRAKFWEMVLH